MDTSLSDAKRGVRYRNGVLVQTAEQRLHAKLRVNETTGCHEWTGTVSRQGYAQLAVKPRRLLAHRLAYEIAKGPIPDGLTIDHLCRNRRCCNPDHLEAVTLAENSRRSWPRERPTHCQRGHEQIPENMDFNNDGRRRCRECRRLRDVGRGTRPTGKRRE